MRPSPTPLVKLEIVQEVDAEEEENENSNIIRPFPTEEKFPFILLVIKLFCSILLHVEMQPKIGDSIERLFYLRDHPHKFDDIVMPYLICIMKMTVELSVEIVCLFNTSFYNDPVDVMMNYIALGCIANLDEVYYNTIRSPLKVQLESADF